MPGFSIPLVTPDTAIAVTTDAESGFRTAFTEWAATGTQ
ncbi:hypothetical protein NJ7G_3153 [Natrinema sp. J7-2]|nr:hypothetical protein NJ7G_3153 [Natrinema sp. J7-2]